MCVVVCSRRIPVPSSGDYDYDDDDDDDVDVVRDFVVVKIIRNKKKPFLRVFSFTSYRYCISKTTVIVLVKQFI